MWTCCQLGAREHYAVPRALQLNGLLSGFITDLWIKRLAGRFHPGLARAQVRAQNISALTFELKAYATRATGWKLITERNDWFQRRAVDQLKLRPADGTHTVFAYSYAAEQIFAFARERGWRTVLGQIDPGPAEERMLADLHKGRQNGWKPAPPAYWSQWHSECSLADEIVVNSAWSRDALISEGIAPEKIRVIPLAYDPSTESRSFQRHYPDGFTRERPLRVLFLGQINLRKGVRHLLDAIKLLAGENIEFWFVGPCQIEIPAELKDNPQVKWFGVVPRTHVDRYYKEADVFIFPTLSDGFGLTQLEAQSWKLPVIASRHCGEVVTDGVNGRLLENVSPQMIADLLLDFLRSPKSLDTLSAQSRVDPRFSLEALASSLTNKCNR